MKTIRIAAISIITSCLSLQTEPVYQLRQSVYDVTNVLDFAVAVHGDHVRSQWTPQQARGAVPPPIHDQPERRFLASGGGANESLHSYRWGGVTSFKHLEPASVPKEYFRLQKPQP